MKSLTHICVALVLLSCSATAYSAASTPFVYSNVNRVVAVGDIHGAFTEFVGLLKAARLVDEDLHWTGGKTHFVSVGDLLDRGPDSKHVLDLLMGLQPQAQAAGGSVHVLLGNHEIMNLTGDLRDVSAAELESHGGLAEHRNVFAMSGVYGSWLLRQPSIIQIDETLFVHGGLSSLTWDHPIAEINNSVTRNLSTLLALGNQLREQALIPNEGDLLDPALIPPDAGDAFNTFTQAASASALGPYGLQWYRGNAACHSLIEAPRIKRALSGFNASRVVVGHTPTKAREVRTRFGGQVIMIDTGMLRSFYKGNPRALVIERATNKLSVINSKGTLEIIAVAGAEATELAPTFVPMKNKQAGRAVAAYRLDRHLGLNMIPQTTAVTGGVNLNLAPSLSEASRAEKQLVRPNYCEVGSAYTLLATFDALIGKFDRGPDNLHYNRRSWDIVALDNHLAFGTSPRVPQYSVPVKLAPALKLALEALRQEDLYTLLDGLLSKREIRTILKRRDQIITWQQM